MARVVFVTAKEEPGEDDTSTRPRRLFIRAKSNIGPDGGGFEYELSSVAVPGHDGMFASAATFGQVVEGDARSVLNKAEGDGSASAGDHARDFLVDILAAGPVSVKAIRKAATDAGLAWRTVERVKKDVGAVARKSAADHGWEWHMGDQPRQDRQGRQEIEPQNVGGLGGLEDDTGSAEVTI